MRIFLSLFLLFAFRYVSAQAPQPSASDDALVFRVSTQFVVLDALVENKKTGTLIGTLGLRDFQVSEDGIPQPVSYFSHDQLPLSVIFLFGLTDTVRPILKPLAEAAREILDHLKPQDETAVMIFSSHTELLQDFTTDRGSAAAAVEKASDMKSGDGTFIHEDMYEAVEQATKSTVPGSRRVLIWLTDGTANFENSFPQKVIGKHAPAQLHSKEQATNELLHSGVVVSALIDRSAKTDAVIAAADLNPFSFITGARTGDVKKYAEMTGGPVLNTSKKEVAARLALLIDQIRDRYTLGYKPAASKPDGTFCKLQVELVPDFYKAHPDLKKSEILVRTRHGYYR